MKIIYDDILFGFECVDIVGVVVVVYLSQDGYYVSNKIFLEGEREYKFRIFEIINC